MFGQLRRRRAVKRAWQQAEAHLRAAQIEQDDIIRAARIRMELALDMGRRTDVRLEDSMGGWL